jgi:hypothetical protein
MNFLYIWYDLYDNHENNVISLCLSQTDNKKWHSMCTGIA